MTAILIKNGTLVTMDAEDSILRGDLLVVEALAGVTGVFRLPATGDPELVLSGPGLVGIAVDRRGGLVVCSNDTAYRLVQA